MRILYIAMAHEYGDPSQGPSFEEMNFASSLEGMGHELIRFDFKARETLIGRDVMNRELIDLAVQTQPDAAFFFLFENEISAATIRAVSSRGRTTTLNWFADDHWRFERFTRHLAPALDWSITTDQDALKKYAAIGVPHVIHSQWGCNQHVYKPTPDELERDVTFVGQPHGTRRDVIAQLQTQGINVQCWGQDWPAGRLDHPDMVRVFCSTRINLNLSNSSTPPASLRARVGALLRRIPRDTTPRPSQIKGRMFEVPGCGGFLLTDRVPYLERYFEPGREIAVYDDSNELADQITYWLHNEDERAAVAEAGYRRVLKEHTYDARFAEIFAAAGLA